ncbi:hypothetical protein AAFP30_20125 [Gordonia sp. CPCC 205515]|uniref:hypothetical protein n=1 Tax=Gordonia sp. CPCC 205515 TaxID=3140791 RepID=UPI003AF3D3D2
MSESRLFIDVDEVTEVVSFYRCAAEVVGAAASDLGAGDLGDWALDDQYRELGDRYREMGRVIAARLAEQSVAADRLSMALEQGLTALTESDADLRDDLLRIRSERAADGPAQ